MNDNEMIDLFFARDPQAIQAAKDTYGGYCAYIAGNLLQNRMDQEECLNDTWLRALNAIPPSRPQHLGPFLGKITRNLAIDRWRKNTAEQRGKGETQLLLAEMAECVAGSESPETELLRKELTASLNRFLRKLPEKDRTVFLLRYYYAGTKEDIARKTGLSSNQVKYILQKVRKQLADTLKKEGLQ